MNKDLPEEEEKKVNPQNSWSKPKIIMRKQQHFMDQLDRMADKKGGKKNDLAFKKLVGDTLS